MCVCVWRASLCSMCVSVCVGGWAGGWEVRVFIKQKKKKKKNVF